MHEVTSATDAGGAAVGDSPAEADRRYRDAEQVLLAEAADAARDRPVPD